ncbi:MAG TPA: tRNA (adenosine(37)-N6)-threonylcarbamoyltransferase complex ATPase subunit type 1 TsaE [Candidatus Babeliales bacterium]|nr:tRNA (adenosine(37)-N6)-threonylcarbamoyltransferase complex ATPase subunit type 1 TsaE [Candidatus Babeliales bacterium]
MEFNQTFTLETLPKLVEQLAACKKHCAIFTFSGSLGAGKTTIIRELLRAWGVKESITSPTFNYVNSYRNAQGETFYHFDLYRIGSVDQFIQAGFDEFIYAPNSWALIEWPDSIRPLLKHAVCDVSIEYGLHSSQRIVSYEIIK